MTPAPGRPPHWWENLLDVIPRFYQPKPGVLLITWLGGIFVLRRPKGHGD